MQRGKKAGEGAELLAHDYHFDTNGTQRVAGFRNAGRLKVVISPREGYERDSFLESFKYARVLHASCIDRRHNHRCRWREVRTEKGFRLRYAKTALNM